MAAKCYVTPFLEGVSLGRSKVFRSGHDEDVPCQWLTPSAFPEQEHFLPPEVLWSRVLIGEAGVYPRAVKHVYPVLCNRCKGAKCVDACPTRATQRRDDGVVWVDAEKCVGCRYCVMACPYQVRTYYSEEKEYYPGQGLTEFEKLGKQVYPHEKGTVVT